MEGELEIGPGKGNWRENWRGIAGAGGADVGGAGENWREGGWYYTERINACRQVKFPMFN